MDARIASLRQEYKKSTLIESEVVSNPFLQFDKWWQECIASEICEPNVMTLGTINTDGFPDNRIVLLKDYSENGFTFFTNYESAKGKAIAANNKVQLLFFWPELERQIRIKGFAEKLSEAASTAYFQSRPKASQIGAWSSKQSETIQSRATLDDEYARLEKLYVDVDTLPKPDFWGGYQVQPIAFEFWQGRASRLHDRISFTIEEENWAISRLSP